MPTDQIHFEKIILAIAILLGCYAPSLAQHTFEAGKVIGVDACMKCHAAEIQRWEQTPHHKTIDELHRKPEAKAIAKKLGFRSVKRNDTCVKCHYTQKETNGRVRIDSGVSCESCHGPAKDWVNLHAVYGPGATRETESAAHRSERRLASIKAGMNNPGNLYLIAQQCLDCHTTPEEKLVDVGGHPAGSTDFELVAWSQGMVRHNFVRSNGTINAISPPERLRVMHIVGIMTDLEYSLRAASKASRVGTFGKAVGSRAAKKKQSLLQIQQQINHPLIEKALATLATLEIRIGNGEAILAAADELSRLTYQFAEEADGNQLSAIDPLLPTPEQYKK